MVRFECDYLEGAPLPVLEAIAKANEPKATDLYIFFIFYSLFIM